MYDGAADRKHKVEERSIHGLSDDGVPRRHAESLQRGRGLVPSRSIMCVLLVYALLDAWVLSFRLATRQGKVNRPNISTRILVSMLLAPISEGEGNEVRPARAARRANRFGTLSSCRRLAWPSGPSGFT